MAQLRLAAFPGEDPGQSVGHAAGGRGLGCLQVGIRQDIGIARIEIFCAGQAKKGRGKGLLWKSGGGVSANFCDGFRGLGLV